MGGDLRGSWSRRALEIGGAYLVITVGVLLLALANAVFLIPNDVFSGGATGLALVITHWTGIPIGVLVLLINIPLLVAGVLWLGGWRFLLRTTYAVVAYSVLLDILPLFLHSVTRDPLLYTLYGGLLGGTGVGLVFRTRGTTGGDDIGAQLLQRFRGIPVNTSLVIVNGLILALVGLVFGAEKGLYALISAFASSRAVDFVLEGLRPTRLVYVISSKPAEIARAIQETTGRGVTFLRGRGGYTGRDYQVILTAVRLQEITVVVNHVREIDPTAFVIINEAREVMGQGFRPLPEPPATPSVPIPRQLRAIRVRRPGRKVSG